MEAEIPDSKCAVIRAYLAKNFSHCLVQEDLDANDNIGWPCDRGNGTLAPCRSAAHYSPTVTSARLSSDGP